MDSVRNDEIWISNEMIPLLMDCGKLTFGPLKLPAAVRTIQLAKISMEESFMLTVCYKVQLVLVKAADVADENAAKSIVKLVVKITPNIEQGMYELYNFPELFSNEIFAYERILPALGWSKDFPKYFYSHIRDTQSAFVLGDFGENGWRVCKQTANLSLEHILVSVTTLGKLHGTMYALKNSNRELFDQFKDGLKEPRFRLDYTSEQWDRRLRSGPKRATKAVRSNAEAKRIIPEKFLTRLETVLENTFLYQKRRVVPEEPLAVLCHGDYLRNNIAFKYCIDKPNVPEAAMMFDFQTLRYSSPMIDLVTFIANSTGVDVRSTHFDEIFLTYHNSLIEHYCQVANCHTDGLPAYLSHENFLREYAKYLPFGLSVAGSFLAILHVPMAVDCFDEISEEDDIKMSFELGGETVDRELRALVQEIYELQQRFDIEF